MYRNSLLCEASLVWLEQVVQGLYGLRAVFWDENEKNLKTMKLGPLISICKANPLMTDRNGAISKKMNVILTWKGIWPDEREEWADWEEM